MAEIKAAWSLFENNTLTYYITGYISDYMFDDLVNEVNFYNPKNIRLVLFSPGGGIVDHLGGVADGLETEYCARFTDGLPAGCVAAAARKF